MSEQSESDERAAVRLYRESMTLRHGMISCRQYATGSDGTEVLLMATRCRLVNMVEYSKDGKRTNEERWMSDVGR